MAAISNDDLEFILKNKLISDKESLIRFPNPYNNLYIRTNKLVEAIKGKPYQLKDIGAVIAFGSAVRLPITIKRQRGMLWWKKEVLDEDYHTKPNDIDIAIICKTPMGYTHINNSIQEHRLIRQCPDYGDWWTSKNREGNLHLLYTDMASFDGALNSNETEPKAILKEGVLLWGDFPHELTSIHKAYWDNMCCEIR